MGVVFLIVIIVIAVWVLASCVRIVPQAYAVILERLGAYQATWSTGIHFKVPFIERVARKVNLKEQVVDFPPQPVITKDNVTMQIDTVVFFQITDPKLYTYGVENPIMAIENLSATTLRNIIGDMELDETLTSRETINTKMRASLDEATDPWGIKVNRVELKNIIPPAAIQDAMEKQMKAERERREAILIAEGQKKSTILVAEGKKQSAILDAEAEKQAAILRAEAQKERMIKEAEGQAEAVLKVQNANAEGIRMIREAGADEAVLTLKSLEAFAKAADGKATKIIIPSDIQKMAGVVTSVTEIAKDGAAYAPLLINQMNQAVKLTVNVLSTGEGYTTGEGSGKTTAYAAGSLIGKVGSAKATKLTLSFSNIALDGRLAEDETKTTAVQNNGKVPVEYHTTHTIFTRATLLESFMYSSFFPLISI